jgi:hypothetical protein
MAMSNLPGNGSNDTELKVGERDTNQIRNEYLVSYVL